MLYDRTGRTGCRQSAGRLGRVHVTKAVAGTAEPPVDSANVTRPPGSAVSGAGKRALLHVPAREIPVPTSISPEAQAMLALGIIGGDPCEDALGGPAPDQSPANDLVMNLLGQAPTDVDVEEVDVGGVPTFVAAPRDLFAADPRAFLDVHGGALVGGGGDMCRMTTMWAANRFGLRVYAPDYGLPPERPYPAGLDDCLAVYRQLLRDRRPGEIAVGEGSAGGNIAAALLLRARDEGLPLPAAAVLLTPEVDLTESGDTFQTMLGIDAVGGGRSLMEANLLYAGGHDLTDPYVSPLFGNFTKGFPPTLLTSGTRDFFLSNTVRMHRALRAAGVKAELHVLEACPHGGFMVDTPEERELNHEIRHFLDEHLAAPL
jgi:epsilon-lactone hydrolase